VQKMQGKAKEEEKDSIDFYERCDKEIEVD
jgi:hypothetical protein